MRKIYHSLQTVSVLTFMILLLGSCMKDQLTKTYTIYSPVYKTKQEVLASVKVSAPQSISSPGKIYIYGKYVFLNELNKGIHIIDNANPSSPKMVGFINIPGNVDIAVKGDKLYADMYADLLTIDISDPKNTKLLKSITKVFPERFYGIGFSPDSTRIIVDWAKKDTTIDLSRDGGYSVCSRQSHRSFRDP